MKYVAFLRGINVGGNNKVEMPRLKDAFEKLGYKNVVTYINTGNVIFETSCDSKELDAIIEKEIEKEFSIKVPVVIRSAIDIEKVSNSVPSNWTNDKTMKTDILFLWDEVNDKKVLDGLMVYPGIDNVKYLDGAIIWNVDRVNINKSGLLKIVGTKLYKNSTVRNINTVRKLNNLLNGS